MSAQLADPDLSVIIVTYNSAHVVELAIDALPLDQVELIVVDNASSDGTVGLISRKYPSAKVIQTGSNLGFAAAANIGVATSAAEVFLLLNPDAVITASAIEQILAQFSSGPTIGVLSPDVIEGHGRLKTMAGGYEPTIARMFTHATGLSRLSARVPLFRGHYLLRSQVSNAGLMDLRWVSGGCLFSRRSVWQELGGLSERWFMYAEDVEYCLRAYEAGWRVTLAPGVTARHLVGRSSDQESNLKTTWLVNLFDLYQSHYRPSLLRRMLWRAVVASGYAMRAAQSQLSYLFTSDTDRKTDVLRFRAYARAARNMELR